MIMIPAEGTQMMNFYTPSAALPLCKIRWQGCQIGIERLFAQSLQPSWLVLFVIADVSALHGA